MEYAVSIIVPVYNAEESLNKCVGSLFVQTLDDLEIILVDDGSTDGSPALCDELARGHENVKVLHNKNGGPALARNAGLEAARGRYIGFVDSDDLAEPDMFARLFNKAEQTGADIVFCDFIKTDSVHKETLKTYPGPSRVFTRGDIEGRIIPYFFGYADGELGRYHLLSPISDNRSYIWACLYSAKLIKSGLCFKSEKLFYNEDNLFNLDAFLASGGAAYLGVPLYRYTVGGKSFTDGFVADYGGRRVKKYEYLRGHVPSFLTDAEIRLRNKAAVETCTVVNYYAGSPMSFNDKKRAVVEYLASPIVSQAVKNVNLAAMPRGREKTYLSLIRHGLIAPLLAAASLYKHAARSIKK